MARTDGYSQYVCDRCGATIYGRDSYPETQQWRDVARVSGDGVSLTRLLCPDCATAYRQFAQAQDGDFAEFMRGGGV